MLINVKHELFYKEWEALIKNRGIKSVSGIYKVIKVEENGNRALINRLIKPDKEGIIYIGQSINLSFRLGTLVNLLNGTTTTGKHTMGNRYQNKDMKILQKHLPVEQLRIEVEFCENPREKEYNLLFEYLKIFGEVPPLNNSH